MFVSLLWSALFICILPPRIAAFPRQSSFGDAIGHLSADRSASSSLDPSSGVSVYLNGRTFINKGLVAFGLIPSNATDSTGDTLGGIGSAIALKSFEKAPNNSYTGTLVVQPDRGFNVDGTVDYQARHHEIDFVLSPYYDGDKLTFTDAQRTLQLTYKNTLLYIERNNTKTTGLDALGVRPAIKDDSYSDPKMPIPSTNYNHLSTDAEGLALSSDGTFWASDEYGPYIYHYDSSGHLLQTIQPPDAFVPHSDGSLNFTSATDPTTGRAANQGFEGLSLDPNEPILYALLQSATIQDGGSSSRYTRLLAYNVSREIPELVGEYVVPLPQSKKGKVRASSEVHALGQGVLLVLARDGHGRGNDDDDSSYKQADLIDISNATDVHRTKFDNASTPVSPDGNLSDDIVPVTYVSFVNYINDTQLSKFGLHNGDPDDQTLIDGKWESLAIVSCNDSDYPDDYFLFSASDNDFMTENGMSGGTPYSAGLNNDNQFFVFRLTLPAGLRRG